MSQLIEDLHWLLAPPLDLKERMQNLFDASDLRQIANYALDTNQLSKLAGKLKALRKNSVDLRPLAAFKLGVVSNATTKLFSPALMATGLRYGLDLDVVEAEFNQVAQEAFSEESSFTGKAIDTVLIAIDYHGLPLIATPGDEERARKTVSDCISYLKAVAEKISLKTNAPIILQNIAPPAESYLGSFDLFLPGTLSWLIAHVNQELSLLTSSSISILNVLGLASNLGLANWHDLTQWNVGKLPFSLKYAPIYADHVCRILSVRKGKSKRCLILDLDNTVWGGIIGDDGVDGILIGNGDPTGEAHLQVQQIALELRNCGIVLAISSKNEDAIARLPFREHPDMLLREEHIAVFQANWSDKATNIRAIAETLSLGLESMVFLDDNPAERLQVRKELPEVSVPELPSDPALYGRTLLAAGYFESVGFSAEDRQRAELYQQNARRADLMSSASNMDSYLASLEMEATFAPFDASSRARIAQLISKSNQFNLTTKRYSELEIAQLEQDPQVVTFQIRLTDSLGDNGMISVIICRKLDKVWEIDTWLMSCRVLGRRLEEAALLEIVKLAKAEAVERLVARYIPTPRNIIVKGHYQKLGFTLLDAEADGTEIWQRDLNGFEYGGLPIAIR